MNDNTKTAVDVRRFPQPVNRQKTFRPGQRQTTRPHGGGGPENAGARSTALAQSSYVMNQNQPSWREFEDDFIGVAARSTTPDRSGGGAHYSHGDLKANSFRALGDLHGGRQ